MLPAGLASSANQPRLALWSSKSPRREHQDVSLTRPSPVSITVLGPEEREREEYKFEVELGERLDRDRVGFRVRISTG